MSDMEPDVKKFLGKIVNSLGVGLLWLFINSTIGIGFNLAFFEDQPTVWNYFFYGWFLISLVLLIAYYRRKWNF